VERPQGYEDSALRYMYLRYIRLSACRWMQNDLIFVDGYAAAATRAIRGLRGEG
jgi:hypothetical protein